MGVVSRAPQQTLLKTANTFTGNRVLEVCELASLHARHRLVINSSKSSDQPTCNGLGTDMSANIRRRILESIEPRLKNDAR